MDDYSTIVYVSRMRSSHDMLGKVPTGVPSIHGGSSAYKKKDKSGRT